ncbi:MAG: hypothetical protein ACTIBY_03070 [Staphylococcus equorum]
MSYERTTKNSVEYIANKFAENPGHFAATILRMYWDMEKQRDQYKSERDTLIDDIAVLKAKVSKLKRENGELQEVIEGKNSDLLFTEEENTRLKRYLLRTEELQDEIIQLEKENEKLVWTLKNKEDVIDWNCLKIRNLKEDIEKYKRGISNLINENELKHNLLSEFSQHIGNKPTSSTYKYFRAKLDALDIREDD